MNRRHSIERFDIFEYINIKMLNGLVYMYHKYGRFPKILNIYFFSKFYIYFLFCINTFLLILIDLFFPLY